MSEIKVNIEDIYLSGKKLKLSEKEKYNRSVLLETLSFNPVLQQFLKAKTKEEQLFIANFCGIKIENIIKWFFPIFSKEDYLKLYSSFESYLTLLTFEDEEKDINDLHNQDFIEYFDALLDFYLVIKALNNRVLYLLHNLETGVKFSDYQIDVDDFIQFSNKHKRFIFPNEYKIIFDNRNNEIEEFPLDAKISEFQAIIKIGTDKRLTEQERYDLIEKEELLGWLNQLNSLTKHAIKMKKMLDKNFILSRFFLENSIEL